MNWTNGVIDRTGGR